MLSKEHRLRHDRDFDRLFKEGHKAYSFPFSLRFMPNQRKLSRFATVVGIKVSKRAVERNRLRRQMREVIRPLLPNLLPGMDVAITAQKEAKGMSYAEIEQGLIKAFKKAKLLL